MIPKNKNNSPAIFEIQNCALHLHWNQDEKMRIVSHKKLKEFYETSGREDSRIALERWYHIAERAEWKNMQEIKMDFPATDYVGNQHYIFNIRGNKYRLVVVIKFVMGCIFIRFVGTHEEYDKIDCSTI